MKLDASLRYSIVVPVYNEAKRVRAAVETLRNYFLSQGAAATIILVDDGSNDQTGEIIRECARDTSNVVALHLPKNCGKGCAVRTGMMQAKGDIALFVDADLSSPIDELPKLVQELANGADIAIGSRAMPESRLEKRQPWRRIVAGLVFRMLARPLVGQINDTQCGFKAFRMDAARYLFSLTRIDRFSFDVELLYLAKLNGYRVAEVGIRWIDSEASSVRLTRDPFNMAVDLLRIRWIHRSATDR